MFSMYFFSKQKTAYEMRISDWSSDVCSSDLCAGFGNHYTGQRQVGKLLKHVDDQLFRFAGCGTVADGDQRYLVPGDQRSQRIDAAFAVAARFEGVDGGGFQHFSGSVDGVDLSTCTYARVQPQDGMAAGRHGPPG